jgi:hypothetical protein
LAFLKKSGTSFGYVSIGQDSLTFKLSTMKKPLDITSVESKADFRQKFVEKFVQQNLPPKLIRQNKISGMGGFANRFKEIEFCAAETPVIGSVEIFLTPGHFSTIRLSVPANSRFFVFCIRDDQDNYRVALSCSLS